MFFNSAKKRASKLLDGISNNSDIMIKQKEVFSSASSEDRDQVELVLVSLGSLLASSFGNNSNLGLELIPAYQKKIMSHVNKTEYDNRCQKIQAYYTEYRDTAIDFQENMTDYFYPLVEKWSEMTANNFGVAATYEAKATIGACIVEMISAINPKLGL